MKIKINRIKVIRDLAFLSILGILVGHLLPIPIIIWRSLFVVLNMIVIVSNFKNLRNIEKCIVGLIFICSLHFLFDLTSSNAKITTIGAILFTVPALILFDFLDTKGVITQKWINISCIVFLLAAVYFYQYKETTFLNEFDWAEEYGFTNNASTIFVGLLLFLLLSDKKIITWGGFLVCWFFLLASAKRGNIVEAVIPTLFLAFQTMKNSKTKFRTFLLLIILFSIGIYFGTKWFNANQFLINKIENANDSGRYDIWSGLWTEWSRSDLYRNMLFGYGQRGSGQLVGMSAHNDWLEILVDYGIIGLFFQIGIFVSLIKIVKTKSPYKLLFIACVGVWLVKSMISMGFKDPLNIFIFVTLGIVLSRITKFQNNTLPAQTNLNR